MATAPATSPRLVPGMPPHGPTRPLVERVLEPFRQFARTASAGGVVLLVVTAIALAWANSPWAESYHHLWELPIEIGAGGWLVRTTLHHLINDGLMAVFFFVVGLEIKREMLAGELSTVRSAALPMLGALGGMVVPALLYTLVNARGPGAPGWGVPMATDIAFALGVLALLGDRVPNGLKVFLAALAIVDDIGAVLVIALFYSGGVAWGALLAAAALLALAAAANAAGVRSPWAYAIVGLALWGTVLASGVHATVAGVLLAMTIPARTRLDEAEFLAEARRCLDDFDAAADPCATILTNPAHQAALEELETLTEKAQAPLVRLEHGLHLVVAFFIMPLFALANAGVSLGGEALRSAAAHPVTVGAFIGLLLGKPIGITLFAWAGVRMRFATLPGGVNWRMLGAVSVLGGIGFTMALFIAGLAFPTAGGASAAGAASGATLLDAAKLGVLSASAIAGVVGGVLLQRALRPAVVADAGAAAGAVDAVDAVPTAAD